MKFKLKPCDSMYILKMQPTFQVVKENLVTEIGGAKCPITGYYDHSDASIVVCLDGKSDVEILETIAHEVSHLVDDALHYPSLKASAPTIHNEDFTEFRALRFSFYYIQILEKLVEKGFLKIKIDKKGIK